jgi:hypothetical protein
VTAFQALALPGSLVAIVFPFTPASKVAVSCGI